ncbi:rab11 family-interacting protein 4A isoform X2 [Ctenocephalides felis]|uniref:rab11 family-interacting protein 4A isoform X2 n=1 Tax=Ctenocephalides felis TaxID=7515 RepID=UPI000E6E39E6|nr:rab11 family-interacting protein 4A isoform X2 [Ctenocephalides felis]
MQKSKEELFIRPTYECLGKRQLGSNALASQLYRSSSFNSSGRSSMVDQVDSEMMYNDASLEDNVLDLNHQVQVLEQKVSYLADSQVDSDDRYSRVRADNAVLQARILMLEEQLREVELRSEERLREEQSRNRDLLTRAERESRLQSENCSIRVRAAETECAALRQEAARERTHADRMRQELERVAEQERDIRRELEETKEEARRREVEMDKRHKEELKASEALMMDLNDEIVRLKERRSLPATPDTLPEQLRLEELHKEINDLREENKNLRESNEELQAAVLNRSVEEGRSLLNGKTSNSLAAELEAMSKDEIQQTLKELQEDNYRLRSYIDSILLIVVENHPQLLEVKPN